MKNRANKYQHAHAPQFPCLSWRDSSSAVVDDVSHSDSDSDSDSFDCDKIKNR